MSAQPTTFRAVLSGGDEVPARDTLARGVATFRLDAGGTELGFQLVVANIENVFAAHIHCGVAGVSGPIGVTLFMGAPGWRANGWHPRRRQRDGTRSRQRLRLDRPR